MLTRGKPGKMGIVIANTAAEDAGTHRTPAASRNTRFPGHAHRPDHAPRQAFDQTATPHSRTFQEGINP
jgi:hypothetical protein